MTPEQRKILTGFAARFSDSHMAAAIRACLAAADRATDPQAEADRRLGAAVRALGIDPKWCDLEADRWDSIAGSIELDTTSAARVSRTFAALHRLLAAALRDEAGR